MLGSILLVLSLSIDALVASFAYGTDNIHIPLISSTVLTFISSLFLLISMSIGALIGEFIPTDIAKWASFLLLFAIGFVRLFEGIIKNFLGKQANGSTPKELNLFDFKLIVQVYGDPTTADVDKSKTLSAKEALTLGIALSLDSLVVGFGAALASLPIIEVLIFSIIFNYAAIGIGCLVGRKCAQKMKFDLSWLSGAILMVLAIIRMI